MPDTKYNKEDFIFNRIEENDGYIDYYFDVTGDSKDILYLYYYDHTMKYIVEVVGSPTDGEFGVVRQFISDNVDVIQPNDKELETIIFELIAEKQNEINK